MANKIRRAAFGELAKKLKRTEEFRVFFWLQKRLEYEGFLTLNVADIARDLEIKSSQVKSALDRLEGIGYVIKGSNAGSNLSYKLSLAFGLPNNGVTALESYREPQGLVEARELPLKKRMKAANITGVIENNDPKTK